MNEVSIPLLIRNDNHILSFSQKRCLENNHSISNKGVKLFQKLYPAELIRIPLELIL